MKTNYNNLTPFEVCIVIAAVIGLALIGVEVYVSMPSHQQKAMTAAFSMFDMHEEFVSVANTYTFATGTMQEFYRQFDIAFNQTFSFPEEIGEPVLKFAKTVNDYSSFVAANYQKNLAISQTYNSVNPGEILGAVFKPHAQGTVSSATIHETRSVYKEYYYHAPSVVQKLFK